MGTKSELLSLEQLIEQLKQKQVIIPLLQRNYKWGIGSEEANSKEATLGKLLDDILEAKRSEQDEYTIGMTTFYEKENIIQIIDGQQRMISLSLIAKALEKYSEFAQITFERDENEERKKFLVNERDNYEGTSADVLHMRTASQYLQNNCFKDWTKEEKNEFYQWMIKHVKIISRYTENEPLHEFLCLNEKKTPFSSTDYDRAYQLKYQSGKHNISPAMIIKEHIEIQKFLYTDENIFKLIKIGYKELPNRMDLIFEKMMSSMGDEVETKVDKLSSYYDNIDKRETRESDYEMAYKYLKLCHKVLRSICQELAERENSKLNVNVYNAVMMLHEVDPDFKFFDLIDVNNEEMSFEKKIKERFSLLGETYGRMSQNKNAFMQSQLDCELSERRSKSGDINSSAYREMEQYVSRTISNIFDEKIKITEELIEKGKNYSQLVKGGKKSFKGILELSEIKQIIVPSIQRDYTLGSNKEYLRTLLFDISKEFIRSKLPEINKYEKGTAALVAYNCLSEGSLWPMPEIRRYNYYNENDLYEYRGLYLKAGYVGAHEFYSGSRDRWGKEHLVDTMANLKNMLSLEEDEIVKIKNAEFFQDKSLNTRKLKFLFSVIFGFLEERGNFYLYDGQQRIVTLVYLSAYLINENYSSVNEDEKKQYDEYIILLKKFRFEERKEANELLHFLLNGNSDHIKLETLKKYVVDHSTYSIVQMLETYENYHNDYGKQILSFNIKYLMEHIIFEFAVIQEASVADQMYMDLNSKNEPLTIYENYKAELVYVLSQRFIKLYKESWEKQIDNNFLNVCYKSLQDSNESNPVWNKERANKAEELEIIIIHWCFKMACMEYGVEIDSIENKTRLKWMENVKAEDIIRCVGTVLNKKIFTDLGIISIFDRVGKDITSKLVKTDFSLWEFLLWHNLRYEEVKFEYSYSKVGDAKVRIYNLNEEELVWLAKYLVKLFKEKVKENDINLKESEMIKYLLGKYHIQWKKGYLEADMLSMMPGFYTIDNDSIYVEEDKIDKALNYFDGTYLCDPCVSIDEKKIDWLEYVYAVKINQRLNSSLYDKVENWENAENNMNVFEPFSINDKKLAWEKFDGNYEMFIYYKEKIRKFEGDGVKLSFEICSQDDIVKCLINEMAQEQLKLYRMKNMNEPEKEVNCQVSIDYSENNKIYKAIKSYINNNLTTSLMARSIIDEIIKNYYFQSNNENVEFYEWKQDKLEYVLVQEMTIGSFKLDSSCLKNLFGIFKSKINTNENLLKYVWTTYKGDKEEWLKNNLNKFDYDRALAIISFDTEGVKSKWKEYYGVLPHD